MDLQTRLEIVQLFYANNRSPTATLRAYNNNHKITRSEFAISSITRLISKFETTFSLHDAEKSGRPSLREERSEVVLESLQAAKASNELGIASSSDIARSSNIPKRSVRRLLKEHLGMHPYHLTTMQNITDADCVARMNFANWMLRNHELLENVLWSDEAYFSLDGVVNKHNCVIWAFHNPHASITQSLHSPKVCVWMAFSASYKLTPFFFDDSVNGENYRAMLSDHMIPQLQRKKKMTSVVFQHDGAPPHFSKTTRELLSARFPQDRVIGRGYGQAWPPRSPDLSPLDYWFWGMLKSRVYHLRKPTSLQELKERIQAEVSLITTNELSSAVFHLVRRLRLVVENDGGHIEHLL